MTDLPPAARPNPFGLDGGPPPTHVVAMREHAGDPQLDPADVARELAALERARRRRSITHAIIAAVFAIAAAALVWSYWP